MPKFEVTWIYSYIASTQKKVIVTADSEEDAREMIHSGDYKNEEIINNRIDDGQTTIESIIQEDEDDANTD